MAFRFTSTCVHSRQTAAFDCNRVCGGIAVIVSKKARRRALFHFVLVHVVARRIRLSRRKVHTLLHDDFAGSADNECAGNSVLGRFLANGIASFDWVNRPNNLRHYVPASLAVIVIVASVINSVQAAPHFRLFTNSIGGGTEWAGYYFPHDEFYDASMRDVMTEIARRARPGARVASESPSLATYYAERAKRPDLICLSLSDPEALKQLDFWRLHDRRPRTPLLQQ